MAAVKPFEERLGKAIPVIAAGGIYTGADIYKFLKMGAAGVQMATRFVATHECDADIAFKQAYVNATQDDIVIIQSPVGLPGRAINNEFLEAVKRGEKIPFTCPYHCIRTCDHRNSPYCIALALMQAKKGISSTVLAREYRLATITTYHRAPLVQRDTWEINCATRAVKWHGWTKYSRGGEKVDELTFSPPQAALAGLPSDSAAHQINQVCEW